VLLFKYQNQPLKGKRKKKHTPTKPHVKIKTALGAKKGFWEVH
jgi:hypothetical protein